MGKDNTMSMTVLKSLDTFKEREFKSFRNSAGCMAIFTVLSASSLALFPETVAVVPMVLVGMPVFVKGVYEAYLADKASLDYDRVLKINKDILDGFELSGSREGMVYKRNCPTLAKRFKQVKKDYVGVRKN